MNNIVFIVCIITSTHLFSVTTQDFSKEYYQSTDYFPKGGVGIKIIGDFVCKGDYPNLYLVPKGKNNGRSFYVEVRDGFRKGNDYHFDIKNPLIIKNNFGPGNYNCYYNNTNQGDPANFKTTKESPNNPKYAPLQDELSFDQIVDKLQKGETFGVLPALQNILARCKKSEGENSLNTANCLLQIGHYYDIIADYKTSILYYNSALSIFKKTGRAQDCIAICLTDLGRSYCEIGDYQKAVDFHEKAIFLAEKTFGLDSREMSIAYSELGETFLMMGNYPKALPLLEKALSIVEKNKGISQHADLAGGLNHIGRCYRKMGKYDKALNYHNQALAISERFLGHMNVYTAQSLGGIASCYSSFGDYSNAIKYESRELEIREKQEHGENHPRTADSLRALGDYTAKNGYPEKAIPLYERALSIMEKNFGSEHPDTAICLDNVAESYDAMGNSSKALQLYNQALEIRKKNLGALNSDTAKSLNNLSLHYNRVGDSARALELGLQALKAREAVLGPQHPDTATSLRNLADIYFNQKNLLDARAMTSRWVSSVTSQMQAMLSMGEKQRLSWASDHLTLDLPIACLKTDKLDELILQWKGIVLDTLLEDRALENQMNASERGKSTLRDIQSLKSQIAKSLIENSTNSSETVERLQRQVDSLESSMGAAVHIGERIRASSQISLDQLSASLPTNGALVDYVSYKNLANGKHLFGASVITRSSDPQWIPLGDSAEIEFSLNSLRKAIASGNEADLTTLLKVTYEKLWKPIETALPPITRQLFLGADGPLNFVSFATLLDAKDKLLSEKYDIVYVGSSRDILRESTTNYSKSLILYANPQFSSQVATASSNGPLLATRALESKEFSKIQLPQLPGTVQEASMVEQIAKGAQWTVETHLEADAAKRGLLMIKSPTVLHLATHGFFLGNDDELGGAEGKRGMKTVGATNLPSAGGQPSEFISLQDISPMRKSGVALSGAQNTLQAWGRGECPDESNDGILTAEEVAGLDLSGTWLVTLSACETGVGEARSGEGVFGLRRAFMMAGAQNLLMTLWPVSDEVTPKIMANFYKEALATHDAAGSLAKVQRDWLVKLRKEKGLLAAVRDAGPFAMVVMAKQDSTFSSPSTATPLSATTSAQSQPASTPASPAGPSAPSPTPAQPEPAQPAPSLSPVLEASPSATPGTNPSPSPSPDASPSSTPVLSDQAPLKKAA